MVGLSVILPSKRLVSSAHHNHLSSRQPLYSNIQKSSRYTSHFITKKIKKVCTQGSRFNKINFYCFIKNIPKRNKDRKQWLLVQSGAIILIRAKAQTVLSAIAFVPLVQIYTV